MQHLFFIFSTVYILAPPPIPPIPPTRFGEGDNSGWKFSLLDMYEGSKYLRDFAQSYDQFGEDCDFSCNPYIETSTAQGLVGFFKYDKIRAVLHVLDYGDTLRITSIATEARDFEVPEKLLEVIEDTENIEIDKVAIRNQLRWSLILDYYK